jgi:chemotaxis signal transduction protein
MTTADGIPALICIIDEQAYAFPVTSILEVSALVKLIPLPDPPPAILGAVNRHGSLIPLLDLRRCLGKAPSQPDLSTLFVVVQHSPVTAGMIVDDIQGVVDLPAQALDLPARSGPYVQGMAVLEQMPVLVLDTGALLQSFAPPELAIESSNP